MSRRDRLRRLHSGPEFAAARYQRGKSGSPARDEMQRLTNAARRGVDVPPEMGEVWKALKRKRMSNEEVAAALGPKIRKRRGRRKGAASSKARRHGK